MSNLPCNRKKERPVFEFDFHLKRISGQPPGSKRCEMPFINGVSYAAWAELTGKKEFTVSMDTGIEPVPDGINIGRHNQPIV